ncbi:MULTISPECIES: signal peptidase I [unclassified Leifsonia]|uniref:signal peptidase I n=1 Tax=unclassified Leifsonia TaxID=2663824 RepID=UPI0009E79A65|nr:MULTISPECIES: signal peptidase I [unclassified Leifsonia]
MTEEDTVLVSTEDQPVEQRPRRRNRGALLFVRDLLIIFLAAILISFLVKTFLIRSFFIPSESMRETLQVHDRIIVNELVPDVVPIERGDVVVFKDPGGWLMPTPPIEQNPVAAAFDWLLSLVGLSAPDSNDHLIKRVIGLPGDHVACCNALGQVSVNGVPLDEPYIVIPEGETRASKDDFDTTVPAGSLWVMGDNRYNSKDSRYNGTTPGKGYVPIDNVVGRAFVVSWPVEHWAWLGDYPETFGGVPDPSDARADDGE